MPYILAVDAPQDLLGPVLQLTRLVFTKFESVLLIWPVSPSSRLALTITSC